MPCRIGTRSYIVLTSRKQNAIRSFQRPHVGYVGLPLQTRMPGCAYARGACARVYTCRRDGVKNLHFLHFLHLANDSKGLQRVGFLLIIHTLHSRL